MEGWQIALIVKPVLLVLFLCVVRLIAIAADKNMPDSRLKRVLFFSWRV